jgi:hypothetical protein
MLLNPWDNTGGFARIKCGPGAATYNSLTGPAITNNV